MKPVDGRIPVAAAKRVAQEFDLRQCLLIGYDGSMVHVVTYGRNKEDCAHAAKAQEFWQGKIREFSFAGDYSTREPRFALHYSNGSISILSPAATLEDAQAERESTDLNERDTRELTNIVRVEVRMLETVEQHRVIQKAHDTENTNG